MDCCEREPLSVPQENIHLITLESEWWERKKLLAFAIKGSSSAKIHDS